MSVESFAIVAGAAARRRIGVTVAMSLLVVLLALVSLGIGAVRMSPLAVAQALFGGGSDVAQVIVREIRLPRMILALSIGAILGLSGAAMQGLLRNPLAEPSLFGAPQAAAFAAVTTLSLGVNSTLSLGLPIAAIFGAFASVALLLAVAGRGAGRQHVAGRQADRTHAERGDGERQHEEDEHGERPAARSAPPVPAAHHVARSPA